MIFFLARLFRSSKKKNTVNIKSVEIFFQRSPGFVADDEDARGVEKLPFKIFVKGKEVKSGVTKKKGLIIVPIYGGKPSELRVYEDARYSKYIEYEITYCNDAYKSIDGLEGQQQRLRKLGYQLGNSGTKKNGADGEYGLKSDRAILQFQADYSLYPDGTAGTKTKKKLKEVIENK